MAHIRERTRGIAPRAWRYYVEEVIVIEYVVISPLIWSVRRLGWRTILSLSLLFIALGSLVLGLGQSIRGLDTGLLFPAALFGVLLGWMLAKSPLPGWLAGTVALILSVELSIIRASQIIEPVMTLMRSLAPATWEMLNWPVTGPPATSAIAAAVADIVSSASSLLNRTRIWSWSVTDGQAAFDPIPVILVWSAIVWLAAVWAGYAVRRQYHPLRAVAPASVLLAVTLSYTWENPILLWVLMATTLILMVLTGQITREQRWVTAGIDFSPELRFDLAAMALPLWVILILAALITPSVSVRHVAESAQQLVLEYLSAGKHVADSMGLEPRAGPGVALRNAYAAGLPNRRLIGSGPELSEEIVMYVYPDEQNHTRTIFGGSIEAPPSYWRALTFDEYTGRGWRTGETARETYRAGQDISRAEFGDKVGSSAARRNRRQVVTAVDDLGGLLYTVGELVAADQDYIVAWRTHHDLFGAEIEVRRYRTDSWMLITSEGELRAAGYDYPDWVRERYLALPPEVPARVMALAHDLTADARTPYDQARAIETHLRAFPYTLDLPAPPPNREITDYFLFDLRRGYCDYYATAMVVLARAVDLPARLVVGYASGIFDSSNARYAVSQADAHSWVEIYFPEIGWVEFEPTGGRPPILRPEEIAPAELAQAFPPLKPITGRWAVLIRIGLLGTLTGLVVIGIAALVWWRSDIWRLGRLPPGAVVDELCQRLYRHGRLLAVPAEAGATPYEFAAGLTERVTALAQDRRLGETSTSTNQDVHWLIALYVRELYSPHKPTAVHRSQAIKTWRRLWGRMWLAWVWKKTRRNNELNDEA